MSLSGQAIRAALPRHERPTLRDLALAILVAFVYFAAAHESLRLRAEHETIASIWPASGLLVAALWSLERRVRAPLLALAWAASFVANELARRDVFTCVALSCVDVGECWLAAWAVERIAGGRPTFTRVREVAALAGLASGAAALLGGAAGAAVLWFSSGAPFVPTAIGWWISAGVGILAVAPAIVAWRNRDRRSPGRGRVIEALVVFGALALVSHVVFSGASESTATVLIAPHAILPLLIWIAARFGPRETSLAILLVATATVTYTASGQGPFAGVRLSPLDSVRAVQAFLAFAALPTLALAALIAERRTAEIELVESRERSARAEAAGRVGTWSVDIASGSRLTWSDETCRIFGIAPAECAPTLATFERRVHPDDLPRVLEATRAAHAGEAAYDIEHRIVRPDGELRWVHANADVVRDGKGQPTAMVGVVRDVTESRRDARLLAGQKSILEAIASGLAHEDTLGRLARFVDAEIEKASCGVMIFDANAGARRVKRAIVPGLGAEFERAVAGLAPGSGIASCSSAASERGVVVTRDIASHPAWEGRRALPLEHGVRSSASAPIIAGDSAVIGTIALFLRAAREPSSYELRVLEAAASLAAIALERGRGAAALQALASELEQRVAERTAELESANRELEAFSYSVSHDLRAPLRSIDGFTSILIDELGPRLSVDVRENLERVSASARRMGKLIDDLLAFSRLSRLPLRKSRVDPTKLAREVVAEHAHELEGRQVEIRVREMPSVLADVALLRQVYANLISNAIKFTTGRAIAHVDIGSARADGELVLWVEDDGVGFDMKHADVLFGVFQRLHSVEEFPGTGVGLALAQRIVQRHGGRIWADAKRGEGARFSFTLGA